uniref:Uncharacterized protein n=1 Tax=Avena sativa TaxID=4498 RepID=A0ACD5WBR4_AVESA
MEAVESAAVVSCECCGLEEECTGEYIGGVRAYFGGRWLCGLCSESVKYEAGRSKRTPAAAPVGGVEEAVRAHMAFCRMLRRGPGPAERVAEGMCQMLRRTACGKPRATAAAAAAASSSSSSRRPTAAPLSIGLQ